MVGEAPAEPVPGEQDDGAPASEAPRGRLIAGAVALFILLALAYTGSIGLRASRTASITGDEPFYLLTTQSLIEDGDLDLANQYTRRSYRSFFDHPNGLWQQSVPAESGAILSPHNAGLSVLLIPGFWLGGLTGVQVQLLLTGALTFVLAFVLTARLTGAPLASWLTTAAVGLSATAFTYSTEIYPEVPAALLLIASVLLLMRRGGYGAARAVLLALLLSGMVWLGVKYAPLAMLVAAFFLWGASHRARWMLLVLGGISSLIFGWFHLATYGYLTPYSLNLVYAGQDVPQLLDSHVAFGRAYRLWGLFVDQRFGLGRWAPVLLAAIPGLVIASRHDWRPGARSRADICRLVVALILTQIVIATFVAVTMMGWWFPGRTLMTVLPLLSLPVALLALRSRPMVRAGMGIFGIYSAAVTGALAYAGHASEVAIAVDPFRLSAPIFTAVSPLFPDYTGWDLHTWVLTVFWIGLGLIASGIAFMTVGRLPYGKDGWSVRSLKTSSFPRLRSAFPSTTAAGAAGASAPAYQVLASQVSGSNR